jgi:ribosome-associated protein
MKKFTISDEYIPLVQLLKAQRIARSGGEAQMLVEEGKVKVNGKPESRKRAKLRHGDIVKCGNVEVLIEKTNSDLNKV